MNREIRISGISFQNLQSSRTYAFKYFYARRQRFLCFCLLKLIYSEKATWLALHRTKVRWRFRKILWPSQNIFNQILTELIFMILTVRTGGLVKKIVKVMSVKLHTRKQFALCCCIFTKISTLIEIWNSTHCGKNSARLTQSRDKNWQHCNYFKNA